MNTQVCSATGDTPYNIVFGTNPRINRLTLQKLTQMGISNEDDITVGSVFEFCRSFRAYIEI